MPEAPVDEPGLLVSAVTTVRLIAGWAFTALAVLNLLMGLDSVPYVTFHVVMLVAGFALLALPHVGRRPRGFAWATGAGVAVLGLVISTVPAAAVECCSADYSVRHGFPFTMLARNPGGAWHTDGVRIIADVLFWLMAGLIVLIAAARLTPASPVAEPKHFQDPAPGPSRKSAPPGPGSHAEERGTRAVDDENVRGLP
jgi:hypothetical protein